MKRLLTSASLALVLLLGMTQTAFAAAFTDVPDTHWASSYIQRAYNEGWVNGMTAITYAPSGTLTRAQFLKMVATAFFPEDLAEAAVPGESPWYTSSWTVAQKYSLQSGTSMSKLSDLTAQINRYDMAQVIVNTMAQRQVSAPSNALQSIQSEAQDWNSVPQNYRNAVANAYALGILNGKNGRFAGSDTMTRAEAAAVLCRMDDVADTAGGSTPSTPGTQTPSTQTPSTQKPSTQTPSTQKPSTQTPSTQTPSTQTSAQTPEQLAAEVVRLVNVERAKVNLPALGTYDSLTQAAQIRAPELITLFSHDRPDGTKCFTALDKTGANKNAYTAGENIAAGNATAAATVEQWMNSPGHKANILNKDFTHIGVAYAAGGTYGHYWVQMFVGTKNVPDSTTTQTPGTQTPSTQTPSTQTPSTQTPSTQTPSTQKPSTQTPSTQTPSTQTPSTQTVSKTPEELAADVVKLVNEERANVGLAPLGTYDSLTKAAQIRAPELPALFSHDRPNGTKCFTALDETGAKKGAYTWGENIAAGSADAAGTMNQWMNSAGHKANILNKDFTHIGVAYCKSSTGYGHYWVQMFIGTKSVPDGSSSQTPSTQTPSTQTPSTQTPSTQIPSTQTPSTQTPSTQNPDTQDADDIRHSSTYLAREIGLSCLSRSNMPSDSFSTTELYVFATSRFYGKDYTVSWSVDNPDILTLEEITSSQGNPAVRFYGKGVAGNARITCTVTTADGMTATQYCDVNVVK